MTKNLFGTVHGALGGMLSDNAARAGSRVEEIRQAMLESLGDSGRSAFPAIERRVRFASDVQGLWYLRGEMMEALSSLQGEYMARRKIDEVSTLFRGVLPSSMSSRQSRLSA
jgi:hypothetical protein